jgi:hypothetical protein
LRFGIKKEDSDSPQLPFDPELVREAQIGELADRIVERVKAQRISNRERIIRKMFSGDVAHLPPAPPKRLGKRAMRRARGKVKGRK